MYSKIVDAARPYIPQLVTERASHYTSLFLILIALALLGSLNSKAAPDDLAGTFDAVAAAEWPMDEDQTHNDPPPRIDVQAAQSDPRYAEMYSKGVLLKFPTEPELQLQFMYAVPISYTADITADLKWIRQVAQQMDGMVAESAQMADGQRHLNIVTDANGQLDIKVVRARYEDIANFHVLRLSLRKPLVEDQRETAAAPPNMGKHYIVFVRGRTEFCGQAEYANVHARANNPSDRAGKIGAASFDNGCSDAQTALHEVGHTIGMVPSDVYVKNPLRLIDAGPEDSTTEGHCIVINQVMCYFDGTGRWDGSGTALRLDYPDHFYDNILDPDQRLYFVINPEPGSYFAENWNPADSKIFSREAAPVGAVGFEGSVLAGKTAQISTTVTMPADAVLQGLRFFVDNEEIGYVAAGTPEMDSTQNTEDGRAIHSTRMTWQVPTTFPAGGHLVNTVAEYFLEVADGQVSDTDEGTIPPEQNTRLATINGTAVMPSTLVNQVFLPLIQQ